MQFHEWEKVVSNLEEVSERLQLTDPQEFAQIERSLAERCAAIAALLALTAPCPLELGGRLQSALDAGAVALDHLIEVRQNIQRELSWVARAGWTFAGAKPPQQQIDCVG